MRKIVSTGAGRLEFIPPMEPKLVAMQKAVHSDPYAMILGAFDIVHLDGHDLRDIGCKARREIVRHH